MPDFREVFARLQAFRSKFDGLLASARNKTARARVEPGRRPGRLRELTGFGANPGNLRMFAYAPKYLLPNAPLVIALVIDNRRKSVVNSPRVIRLCRAGASMILKDRPICFSSSKDRD